MKQTAANHCCDLFCHKPYSFPFKTNAINFTRREETNFKIISVANKLQFFSIFLMFEQRWKWIQIRGTGREIRVPWFSTSISFMFLDNEQHNGNFKGKQYLYLCMGEL